MVWVRLDDHFDQNPKIASVGPLGIALWTVGLAYCNRNLTDGFIPWNTAKSLLSWEYLEPPNDSGRRKVQSLSVSCGMAGDDVDSSRVIDLLVYAGLWDVDDERGGFFVHDYADFQPLKEQVIEDRRGSAERTARSRATRNSASNSASNTVGNTVTDGASNTVGTPAPVPVPVASNEATDAGFRDRYGTLTTAFGGVVDQRLADEFTQIATDHTLEEITTAIADARRARKRIWPSVVLEFIPEPKKPMAPEGILSVAELDRLYSSRPLGSPRVNAENAP